MIKARIVMLLRFLTPLVISALVVYDIFDLNRFWYTPHTNAQFIFGSRGLTGFDSIDLGLILRALATKHSFLSTFSWWHTSWIKEVPFWRPLTIQTFWIERYFFTDERYDRWFWVTFFAHLTCVAFFGWFVSLLTQRKDITWLAVLVYAAWRGTAAFQVYFGFLGNFLVGAPGDVASDAWKNQPDLFADTFFFASLVLMLKKRYWPAMAMGFISVAFKESGWMTWIIAGLVLLYTGQLKTLPKPVFVGVTLVIVTLLAFRFSAGMDVVRGYHQGSNSHWADRLSNVLGGNYVGVFFVYPYCFILAHGIFFTTWLRKRGMIWQSWVALIVGVGASLIYQMHVTGASLDVAIVTYADSSMFGRYWRAVINVLVCLYCAEAVLANPRYRNLGLLAAGCSVIAALPYAAAGQVLKHALHQSYAFQSLVWTLGLLAIWDAWQEKWRTFMETRRGKSVGAIEPTADAVTV